MTLQCLTTTVPPEVEAIWNATYEMVEAAYEPVYSAVAHHKYKQDMYNVAIGSYRPYEPPPRGYYKGEKRCLLGARKIP